MVAENYKGYKICHKYKTKWHKNNISGHEWSTNVIGRGFYVIGVGIFSSVDFSNIEKAKEAIDFAIKFQIGRE